MANEDWTKTPSPTGTGKTDIGKRLVGKFDGKVTPLDEASQTERDKICGPAEGYVGGPEGYSRKLKP